MKVFIVDDEAYIRDCLSSLIDWNNLGFDEPLVFADAESAIEYIGTTIPFLIISDIKMPKLNGLDFAKTIYEKNIKTNFFILSAYDEFSFAIKAMHYGVKRYFIKPISIQDMVDAISSLIVQKPRNPKVERISDYVLKYIDSNIANASIKEISTELGISPNHLSMVFHRETGKTFKEELLERKMELAVSLIEKGADKQAAAEAIGYQDISSFKKQLASYLKDRL